VRSQVEEIIGQARPPPPANIPSRHGPRRSSSCRFAKRCSSATTTSGTEHILLGLIREGEGVAAQVLQKLGADLNRVRQQVIQLLQGYAGKARGKPGEQAPQGSMVLDQFGRNLTQLARETKLDP